MTDIHEVTEPKKKPIKRAKGVRKAKPVREKPLQAPEEFAGMTATDCCNACYDNATAAQEAQHRLNEIEMMYPRRSAPPVIHPTTGWRMPAATVMENDEQYLMRNPQIAEEFTKLGKALLGKCHITGHPGCAHPHKGGMAPNLHRDPKASARYQRAKRVLAHQKIDLTER